MILERVCVVPFDWEMPVGLHNWQASFNNEPKYILSNSHSPTPSAYAVSVAVGDNGAKFTDPAPRWRGERFGWGAAHNNRRVL